MAPPSWRPDWYASRRCDPRMVEQGIRLVEANARDEGIRHAAQGYKMRVQTIPVPYRPAYIEGFLHEWNRRSEEASRA